MKFESRDKTSARTMSSPPSSDSASVSASDIDSRSDSEPIYPRRRKHHKERVYKRSGVLKRASTHQDDGPTAHQPEGLPTLDDVLGTAPESTKTEDKKPAVKKLVTRLYRGPLDRDGYRNWVEEYPDDVIEEEQREVSAITLRFKKDTDELREKPLILHSITVKSAKLKKLLRKVFESYPSFARELQKGKFEPPFTEFVHRWPALRDEAKNAAGTRLGEEVEALCEALEEELGGKPEEFNKMAKQNVVTWALLDYLYVPGTVLITRSRNIDQAQRIVSTEYDLNARIPSFDIDTEYIDFDGKEYGLRQGSLSINTFKGSRAITSLPGIPLARHSHQKDVEDKLRIRGGRIVELNKASYMQYSGFIWMSSSFAGRNERFVRERHFPKVRRANEWKVEGRVLIDGDGYSKYQYNSIDVQPLPTELSPDVDCKLNHRGFAKRY